MASGEQVNNQKEYNSLIERLNELTRKRVETEDDLLDLLRDNSNILQDQTKALSFQVQEKSKIRSISRELVNISENAFSLLQNELGLEKTKQNLYKNQQQVTKDILLLEQLKGKTILSSAQSQQDLNNEIENQIVAAKKLRDQLENIETLSNSVSRNLGTKIFGALEDITKAIPGLRTFSSPFEEASEAARQQAALNAQNNEILKTGRGLTEAKVRELGLENQLLDKNGNILTGNAAAAKAQALNLKAGPSAFMAGIKTLGPALRKALGPITLITELIKGLGTADKETTELAKSMALTKSEAANFRQNLVNAANASGMVGVTASRLVESLNAANKELGFITKFSTDTLITQTKLSRIVGIGAENAAKLSALSESRGTNAEAEYKSVLSTSYELQRQAGVQFDLRDILKAVANTSGQLRANLAANPAAIAEAVTLAKQLGGSLDDVKAISSAILDFESSIAAELEAELLTGKQINLEKARLAALNGDIAGLEREIADQLGTFTEFSEMNVIQQEALANAFGLSSDRLADMLFQQQVMGRSAEELRAAGEDELAKMVEQQTMQEKFNDTVEKLQAIFTDVATAFMPLLEGLSAVFDIIGKILEVLNPVAGLLTGIATGFVAGGIPGAIVGGIIGGIGDLDRYLTADSSPQSIQDGITDSNDGPFEITNRYGQTAITAKGDGIAVSPNITRENPKPVDSITKSQASEMISLLNKIANKDTNISMDSRKLNSALMTSGVSYTS